MADARKQAGLSVSHGTPETFVPESKNSKEGLKKAAGGAEKHNLAASCLGESGSRRPASKDSAGGVNQIHKGPRLSSKDVNPLQRNAQKSHEDIENRGRVKK